MKCITKIIVIGAIYLLFVDGNSALAQRAQLSLTVEINEMLIESQAINLQSLISTSGKGPNLFRMYVRNESSTEHARNLYFNIGLRSEKIGLIANVYQNEGQPFSLNPAQTVYATNNNINNRLPGVEESIQLDGKLTSNGRQFINSLQGSTYLPPDRYTIEIEIYEGHNKRHGGIRVASAVAEMGVNMVDDKNSTYLLSPGNTVSSDAEVNTRYPNFRWQGITGASYRLIVVEARVNASPRSLISGAKSTAPIQLNAISGSGSLIDYEMLDVIIEHPNFQYPGSGVQTLEPGKKYYWQISTQLKTVDGIETHGSEIWGFTISERVVTGIQNGGIVKRALKKVLGERFEEFMQRGYSFQSIEIGGQIYQGGQALQKLIELSRKAEQGEVSIIIEEQ